MTRRTRRTPQQWQAIIDRQADSGESASQFCDSNALSYPVFCRWRAKLTSTKPIRLTKKPAPLIDLSSLVSIPQRQVWDIELELGDGMTLRMRRA